MDLSRIPDRRRWMKCSDWMRLSLFYAKGILFACLVWGCFFVCVAVRFVGAALVVFFFLKSIVQYFMDFILFDRIGCHFVLIVF
jgi:hypothetical protein